MARLTNDNVELAREIMSLYPRPKSALISLLHLAQEQDGHLTDSAMAHIGELVGVSSAEVLGTASFYEMFKMEPVGRYMVNICTNISCQLVGGEELLAHAESTLGIRPGQTTPDGLFTLEDVECIAACTEAPCLQVNYRYEHRISNEGFDQLVNDLRTGNRSDIPDHGVLAQIRQHIPEDRRAGSVTPEDTAVPAWISAPEEAEK
ncbi:MAG: NAD(P)H-dependent oxidoreductase subunit E [Acidimicrobiales bacterium]